MASTSSHLSHDSASAPTRSLHQADPYVIVKFDRRQTKNLEQLYDVAFDRYDEATERDHKIIRDAFPSVEQLSDIVHDLPAVGFRRVFESIDWNTMQGILHRTVKHPRGDKVPPMPELDTYFRIDFKAPRTKTRLSQTQTSIWDRCDETPETLAIQLRDNCKQVQQAFVGFGIGADYTHRISDRRQTSFNHDVLSLEEFRDRYSEADGRRTRIVDVEQGWEYDHPALPILSGKIPISGINRNWAWSDSRGGWVNFGLHGLMVLGLVAARDGIGIAPATTPYLASEWKKPAGRPWMENTAEAIVTALTLLEPGDVILIEGQQVFSGENLPVEADEMIFQAIVAAHHLGITVIEAAGSNYPTGRNLDTVTLPGGRKLFEKDSGAILVAAGVNPDNPTRFYRDPQSNYGSRIDCFADGDSILALDSPGAAGQTLGDYELVEGGGTSSASAIIAGVALVLQGLNKGLSRPIHPWTLREWLRNDNVGTHACSTDGSQPMIGVMPNLRAIDKRYGPFKMPNHPVLKAHAKIKQTVNDRVRDQRRIRIAV